jgi:hypothetical protein
VAGLVIFPLLLVLEYITQLSSAYGIGIAVNFAVQILTFSLSLSKFEKNGVE